MLKTYPPDLYSIYSKLIPQCSIVQEVCRTSNLPSTTELVLNLIKDVKDFIALLHESHANHSAPINQIRKELDELMNHTLVKYNSKLSSECNVVIELIDEYIKNQELCSLRQKKIKQISFFKNQMATYKPKLEELAKKIPGLCSIRVLLEQFTSDSNLYCFFSPKNGSDKKIDASFSIINDIYEELKNYQNQIQEKNLILFMEVFRFFENWVISLGDSIKLVDNQLDIIAIDDNDNTKDLDDDFCIVDEDGEIHDGSTGLSSPVSGKN